MSILDRLFDDCIKKEPILIFSPTRAVISEVL